MKQLPTEPEILLCSNIPRPMFGMAPRVVLGSKWWNRTRKQAYKSNWYHCLACGIWKQKAKGRKWLEGHELYQVDYEVGKMHYLRTVPLCHYCHNYIHDGRMRALLQQEKLHHFKFKEIIQHGDNVLRKAGLVRLSYEEREKIVVQLNIEGKLAPWKEWRLVIGNVEYPPKFKSEAHLRMALK